MTPTSNRPRFKIARSVLVWIGVIAVALFPFPWWW